jgi:mono/diheme cytochrome c family protein
VNANCEWRVAGGGRRAVRRATRHAPLAALLLLFAGCEWFTDFKQQPKIDPWESPADTVPPRASPQYSVPITGTFAPAYAVSYLASPVTVDSMSGLVNPTPPSDSSLANGRRYYQINCAVCHGDNGGGNGPVIKYSPAFAISLIGAPTQARSDGYIYGMIRNGRGLMPTYDRIEEMDRWDVVNYVRALQGRLDRPAAIGPLGYPGQGGFTVPTYTAIGPTRPVPHNVSQYTDSALARQVRSIEGSTAVPTAAEHGAPR